jgi:hypothetical protein
MGIMAAATFPEITIASVILLTVSFSVLMGATLALFNPKSIDAIIDWVLKFWR